MRVVEALRDLEMEPVKSPPRAVVIELDLPEGVPLPGRILVIDLPSEQGVDRLKMARKVAERLQSIQPGLILGDLNMAPRSPALSALAPGFEDAFRNVGRWWGGTWPRESPWLRIDFALTQPRFNPTTIRTFDPGAGGHRGLVMEYSD
jgi:endonuclease/exonuclease/phosphatase family metal-dependent hydrolase